MVFLKRTYPWELLPLSSSWIWNLRFFHIFCPTYNGSKPFAQEGRGDWEGEQGDSWGVVIFYFLTWMLIPWALYFPCSEIKLQNTGEDTGPSLQKTHRAWEIWRSWDRGHLEGMATCLPTTYPLNKSHPKGAFSNSSHVCAWRDHITY